VQKGTDAGSDRAVSLVNLGKDIAMLSTVIIVLIVLWLLGVVTSYTMGGLIHILLVIAVIVVLLRIIQGRNPIQG
jgi:hypothetical protein